MMTKHPCHLVHHFLLNPLIHIIHLPSHPPYNPFPPLSLCKPFLQCFSFGEFAHLIVCFCYMIDQMATQQSSQTCRFSLIWRGVREAVLMSLNAIASFLQWSHKRKAFSSSSHHAE